MNNEINTEINKDWNKWIIKNKNTEIKIFTEIKTRLT